jgi:hypothetical protein
MAQVDDATAGSYQPGRSWSNSQTRMNYGHRKLSQHGPGREFWIGVGVGLLLVALIFAVM